MNFKSSLSNYHEFEILLSDDQLSGIILTWMVISHVIELLYLAALLDVV